MVVRRLNGRCAVVSWSGTNSDLSGSRAEARATAGRSARSIDRASERAWRRARGTRRAPDATDREKAFDRLDLAGDAVDILALEVGRKGLRDEAAAGRPRSALPGRDALDERGERGRLRVEERAVMRQAVVRRRSGKDVRAAKRGEPRGP